jgi:hypothetical protein
MRVSHLYYERDLVEMFDWPLSCVSLSFSLLEGLRLARKASLSYPCLPPTLGEEVRLDDRLVLLSYSMPLCSHSRSVFLFVVSETFLTYLNSHFHLQF